MTMNWRSLDDTNRAVGLRQSEKPLKEKTDQDFQRKGKTDQKG
jgi:hypothetical protein